MGVQLGVPRMPCLPPGGRGASLLAALLACHVLTACLTCSDLKPSFLRCLPLVVPARLPPLSYSLVCPPDPPPPRPPGQVLQPARGVPPQPALQPPHGAALPVVAGRGGAGGGRRRKHGGWHAGACHRGGAYSWHNTGGRRDRRNGGGSGNGRVRGRRCVGCQLRGCRHGSGMRVQGHCGCSAISTAIPLLPLDLTQCMLVSI